MQDQTIKCLVWDLDNTVWKGTLLEDGGVTLREEVVEILTELDRRGILCSVSSRNDHATAIAQLADVGLDKYFLVPEINWNPKSTSIRAIAAALNIGTDCFAFVDDEEFEREEVSHELPEVLCLDAAELRCILDHPRFRPRFITAETCRRRRLYIDDLKRDREASEFVGDNESFLATLGMVFEIREATEDDLQRAEELTLRTHQLNTTGYTYDYEELDAFRRSGNHVLLVARLTDRFGPYGTIGLCLVERSEALWTVKLLLMSCRVMSRGVGTVLMNRVMRLARDVGARLRAEFVPNGRNRMMYVTYRFGGFQEIDKRGEVVVLENPLEHIPPIPEYVDVQWDDGAGLRN